MSAKVGVAEWVPIILDAVNVLLPVLQGCMNRGKTAAEALGYDAEAETFSNQAINRARVQARKSARARGMKPRDLDLDSLAKAILCEAIRPTTNLAAVAKEMAE